MTREQKIKAKCEAFDSKWGTMLRLIHWEKVYAELKELQKDIDTIRTTIEEGIL